MTAEAFARALAALPRFRWQKGGFGAWLFRIARNLSVGELRHQAGSVPLPPDDAPGALGSEVQPGVEEAAVDADLAVRLRTLVRELPGEQREVVLLKFAAGLDNRQIAAATGRTPTAVSSLVFRVTRKLRKELD